MTDCEAVAKGRVGGDFGVELNDSLNEPVEGPASKCFLATSEPLGSETWGHFEEPEAATQRIVENSEAAVVSDSST